MWESYQEKQSNHLLLYLTIQWKKDATYISYLPTFRLKYLFSTIDLHLSHRLLKMTSVTLTRILQLPPCLWYQWEAPGQRLDQTSKRGVGHHDHLLPVMLLEEGLQDWAGGLRVHTLLKYAKQSRKAERVRSHLAVEAVMIEHVVVTELVLTVELCISETKS